MRLRIRHLPAVAALLAAIAGRAAAQAPPAPAPSGSPLSFHLGPADFVIGGFLDATSITRSTNVASGIGTAFGSIPFSDTTQGNLTETRLSAQNSRVSLTGTAKPGADSSLRAHLEGDFLGTAPATLNEVSGSNTFRMRLYWLQYRKGGFEFLGGQSWSLMTPNRTGVSPIPADLFYTQNVDANYQVGLTWARQTQFRVAVHPSATIAAALSVENPQQYVGPGVVLPTGFDPSQLDATGNVGAPNPYPDIIGKVAFDPHVGETHQHIEIAGIIRGFETYNNATATNYSATGRGIAVNTVLEPVRPLHVIANAFFSDGGGRYIFALGPDFIVDASGKPALVGGRSALLGLEAAVRPATMVFGYFGTARFDQLIAVDDHQKAIGYGVPGSTAANRHIDETTAGVVQTFFRNPTYGAVQLMVQYSYVTREPWSVPAGTLGDAKTHMLYVDMRYILP